MQRPSRRVPNSHKSRHTAEDRVPVSHGGKAAPRHVGCIRPRSSKRENQLVSFYGLPLKLGTLDPPSAVTLLPAPVYFWTSPLRVCDSRPSVPLVYFASQHDQKSRVI